MRGNAWQITAIISIILVVLLIIPIVIMGRQQQTLHETAQQARADQTSTAQRAATLEGEVRTLKALIGVLETVSTEDLRVQHAELIQRALPGEDPNTQTLIVAVAALFSDLEREREGHRRTNEQRAQLESDLNNEERKYAAAIAQVRTELRRAEDDRDRVTRDAAAAKTVLDRQLQEAQSQQDLTLARSESVRHQLNEQVRHLTISNLDIRESNQFLSELLSDIRNPNVEQPAGKIISVNQQAGTAIVNLGSADGLLIRTMFSVYHSGVTGLSFRTGPVGRDEVYCDVCMREVNSDISKASVEVMRILGPHQAEVRILDDILTDPIMVGDVVYSPIWKPGQKLRFALAAGMQLPGTSTESGTEAIRRLIEMNGGAVDCWIDENAMDGAQVIHGGISDLTNFIVINERVNILNEDVAREHKVLIEEARNRAVKAISLEELLRRMSWKNMTPVDTFGSLEFLPEMRVIPQHQGSLRQSPGVVAPMFTPDDPESRLNAREAAHVRNSPNAVSPIFDGAAPAPPASSGRTSELFRPRRPQ